MCIILLLLLPLFYDVAPVVAVIPVKVVPSE